jgi:hypothetical protein
MAAAADAKKKLQGLSWPRALSSMAVDVGLTLLHAMGFPAAHAAQLGNGVDALVMPFSAEDALGKEQFDALDEETRAELEAVTTADGTCAPVAGFLVRACAAGEGSPIQFPALDGFWFTGAMVVVFDDALRVTDALLLSAPRIVPEWFGGGVDLAAFRRAAGVVPLDLPAEARAEWEAGLFSGDGSPTDDCRALQAKRAEWAGP